jgi:glycosyltransferase XagB
MANLSPVEPIVATRTRSVERTAPARLLGETLIGSGLLAREALDGALAVQREIDAPLGRILLAERAISVDDLVGALAVQANLPLVDLAASPPDAALLQGLDPYLCLKLEAVPWRQVGDVRVIAIGNPLRLEAATEAFGGGAARVEHVLAKPEDLRQAVIDRFGLRLRDDARDRCPAPFSCRGIASRRTRIRALCGLGALRAAAAAAPAAVLAVVMSWVLLMNTATMGLRLFAIFARFRVGRARIDAEVPRLAYFQRLPTVSLLVPLKGEAAVAAGPEFVARSRDRGLRELQVFHSEVSLAEAETYAAPLP